MASLGTKYRSVFTRILWFATIALVLLQSSMSYISPSVRTRALDTTSGRQFEVVTPNQCNPQLHRVSRVQCQTSDESAGKAGGFGASSQTLAAGLTPICALAIIGSRSKQGARLASSRTKRCARGGENADELLKEAARLRAEVEALTGIDKEKQVEKKKKAFAAWDKNKNGTIEVDELVAELAVDRETAQKIMQKHDSNKDGVLQFEEFDENQIKLTAEKFKKDERDKEFAKRKDEMDKERDARKAAAGVGQAMGPDDTGIATRVLSVCVYILPFCTVLPFGAGIGAPMLGPIWDFALAWNSFLPLRFIVFLGLLFGSENEQLPLLLRVNMRSAALLDTAIGLAISLWLFITLLFMGGPAPLMDPAASLLFLGVIAIIGLSVITSLFGSFS